MTATLNKQTQVVLPRYTVTEEECEVLVSGRYVTIGYELCNHSQAITINTADGEEVEPELIEYYREKVREFLHHKNYEKRKGEHE
jgi:hypothetical protein